MSEGENTHKREEPIIIKKKKGHGGHGHHGGAWKVAYADFVTAMMAFFIVMWILGQSEEVKKQVEAFFKDPGAFNFFTGKRASPIDLNLVPEEGKGKGDEKKQDFFFVIPPEKDTNKKITSEAIKKALNDSIVAAERVKKMASEFEAFIQNKLQQAPELKEILSSIKIEMTKDGLRIELLETQESVFFEVGSSKVTSKAREILAALAREIGKLPNYISIEGHTDSRKYAGQNYSNWELSADRANASRKILEANGLWEGQVLMVTGYADRKLRNPDNPFDVSNRRISILIKPINSSNFLNSSDQ
ncbi:MAG: OmpA family protein [Candidatus Kapabacteria bacterium]|nr:OmpA family protein [Candidatus Kapabacteria bacterium]